MPDSGDEPPLHSPSTAKVLFETYELGRLLGVGAFAKVYYARHTRSGHSVAIKMISKSKSLRCGLSVNIQREIAAMRRLHHPHIIRLLEVLASRSTIYFVMEYAKGGELFARLSSRGRLPENQSRRLFHQLISAVAFCHSRGVFHRDLKPENLLLDEFNNLKLSDFGLSAVRYGGDALFQTLCGTPAYVAPEILLKKGYDGAQVDIWSCGVILFVMNAGYLPFNDPNLMAMYRKIYRGEYRCPKWTSAELKWLISRMLDTNPATRITIEGILADPWFRKEMDEERMRRLIRFREDIEDRIMKIESEDDERDLNAFDIISMSGGFDLSGFFNSTAAPREMFVVGGRVDEVLERVEEVGKGEGLRVRRRRRGEKGRGGAAVDGRMGNLVAWVEVSRLSPEMVMVGVERGIGEEAERLSREFWREKLATRAKRKGGELLQQPAMEEVGEASTSGESSTGSITPIAGDGRGPTITPASVA
ncbi:CBL-interacting serine/threonine-protein kinase 14-like [Phalaenopsis equestris]|uniref:CBL-interacting serine/threonine-protein kinase 14-like n=1 Tax=Phalaenopsis equestris TaxID=78828 RepID=UPI0009E1E5AB|nr:CBL-interacting serine/threonine-protein kinase 14-like [Phalaenopsis equestris]